MAEHRATKSGLAAEAHNKIQSKYDPQLASELIQWVKEVTGSPDLNTDGGMDNFFETFKNGVLLCKLINVLKPGAIPDKKIHTGSMAFKCMENIQHFLTQAKELGVAAEETFQSVDLWEKQNLLAVCICLQALARKAPKYGVKGMGPKEADPNVRNFSEEVLKQSEAVIGLQYGSNKGATQSGINFGNTRHM